MALFLNIIFSLAFAGAVGGAVHLWRTHLDAARRDEMQALAARRGWALTITGERLGRAGTLRLVPRGGHPWIAEVRPPAARAGGGATDFEAEIPCWADGTLVLVAARPALSGPAAAPDQAQAKDGDRPSTPPPQGAPLDPRVLRDLLGEDVARLAGLLVPVPAPEGVTALAAGDPTRRVDLGHLSQALRTFAPVAPGSRGRPVLILSQEGTRLRVGHPIRRPDQMERFLDLAFEISRLIGP